MADPRLNDRGKFPSTSARHRKFAERYVLDFNGTKAAIEVGYSADTAATQACRLLKEAEVQEYVRELQLASTATHEQLRLMVLEELARIARGADKDSDRVSAMKLLMSHLGMDAPIKTEVSGELGAKTLAELMALKQAGG